MSAQEREALLEDLLKASWPDGGRDGFPTRRTGEFIVDALLAAGWSRPVSAGGEVEAAVRLVVETTALGVEQAREYLTAALELVRAGEVEAATDDVIERVEEAIVDEIHNQLSEFVSWAEDTDDAPGYHVLNDVPLFEVALVARKALADAGLLAGGVPGRSEAEIKAEALREAADDLEASQQLAVDFHGNRFAVCGTPWLRARAARVAGTTEAGDE